jgi:putative oxidoreductase
MHATPDTYSPDVSIEPRTPVRRQVERWAPLIGRTLLAAIFLVAGLSKIADFWTTVGYMQAHGVPAAELLAVLAIGIEIGAGIALLLGGATRLSAIVLLLYMIPVTLIFHAFWAYAGAEQRTQLINFLKNLAIMGGLTYIATYGAGLLALDARRRRNVVVHRRPMGRPFRRQPIGT